MRARACHLTLRLIAATLAADIALPQTVLADAQADFTARYAQLRTAMESRDAKAIKALLAPKFQSIDVRGEASDADEMIDDLGRLPPSGDRKSETTLKTVTVTSDTAMIEESRDIKLSHVGQDGTTHAIEFVTVSDDSWVQSPSGWLLASTTAKEMTMMRDGTVLRHIVKGDK